MAICDKVITLLQYSVYNVIKHMEYWRRVMTLSQIATPTPGDDDVGGDKEEESLEPPIRMD